MFHNTDTWLQQRLITHLPKGSVRAGWPTVKNPKKPLLFYQLLHVQPQSSNAATRRLPLTFSVDYILIPTASTSAKRHELLGKTAICVAEEDNLSFINEPIPETLLPPSHNFIPYLRVRTLWRHERAAKPVPPVTIVDIHDAQRQDVHGVFIDPNGKPMAHETISIPALNVSAQSNERGQFHFANIFHQPGRELVLHMRGRDWVVTPNKRPLTIHFTPKES